jgi:hypothetical protein
VPVTFNIKVPGATATASNRRTPQYVSAGTQTATIKAYDGTSPTSHPLLITASFPCTATGCTGSIAVPATTVIFDVGLHDAANVTLSEGAVTQVIKLGQSNVVHISLGGVIASLAMAPALSNPTITFGTPSSVVFNYVAKDADGYTIIGNPVQPSNGIFVGVNLGGLCATNAVVPSQYKLTLDTTASTIALAYDGSINFTPADIEVDASFMQPSDPTQTGGGFSCSATTTVSSNIHMVTGQMTGPANTALSGTGSTNAQTAVISEPAYGSKLFTVDTSDHKIATATVGPSVNGVATVTVTGVAAGFTSLVVTDSFGKTLTIPVSVTTTAIFSS